jgi:hypothetical protein
VLRTPQSRRLRRTNLRPFHRFEESAIGLSVKKSQILMIWLVTLVSCKPDFVALIILMVVWWIKDNSAYSIAYWVSGP